MHCKSLSIKAATKCLNNVSQKWGCLSPAETKVSICYFSIWFAHIITFIWNETNLPSLQNISEEMCIAKRLYKLDTDGNTYLAFLTPLLTVLNVIVKTGSGSDTSQITDHSSDADTHILIIITKISIWVCGNEGERHLKGGLKKGHSVSSMRKTKNMRKLFL